MKVWLCSKHKYSGQDKCPQCMEEQVMDNELHNGKREMDEMHKDRPFIQERVSDKANGLLKADPFYLGVEWLGAWLVDHCEGETVSEELVVKWCSVAWAAHILRQNAKNETEEG